jgi:hypothetical protein
MNLGAYRVYGHYGDHRAACRGVFSLAYVGPGADCGDTSVGFEARAANLALTLKKLTKKGFGVVLDLERHRTADGTESILLPIGQVLKAARPFWGWVDRVVLADESPSLDYFALTEKVRTKVGLLGLQPKPLGAVFTPAQILNGDARIWSALDWVGLEAYTEVPTEPQPAKSVRRKLDAMAERIGTGSGKVLIPVARAFTRNNTFTNQQQILGVNKAAVEFARDFGAPAVLAFRYGQAGGIKDLPALDDYYREVARG